MNEILIKSGETVHLDTVKGNLKINRGATIIAKNDTIVVQGAVLCKRNVTCEGNLKARSLKARRGDFEIYGNLELTQNAQVDNKLLVTGDLIANLVTVGGALEIEGN
ncbi:MAG: hypothetical protein U9O98_03040, partial [Asgard group archaeon]|nr:hypothetical protein [Asgard group archaeon]